MPLFRHVAPSLNGQIFATAEYEQVVSIWGIEDGRLLGVFRTQLEYGGRRLALSPDGTLCAAGAYDVYGVSVYRIPDGALLWTRPELTRLQWLEFDPRQSTVIAGFDDKPLLVMDGKTGQIHQSLRNVRRKYANPYSGAFILDGTRLELYTRAGQSIPIERRALEVLCTAFNQDIAYLTEARGWLRAIDCTRGNQVWEYNPEPGFHLTNLAYNRMTGTLFGVLVSFERGGSKLLFEFDAMTGRIVDEVILDGEPGVTEFGSHGSRLVTSEGYIYRLEVDQKTVFRFGGAKH